MLSFSDMPYAFIPPRPSPPVIWTLRQINRLLLRSSRHRIHSVEVRNGDPIRRLQDDGAHLLFLPNHSTHSDVEIVSEAYRRLGLRTQFMAAYDVFLRNRIKGWLMQRGGAFSVDREGADKQAMKQAVATLTAGDYGLTIFPEGNVYLTNERVTAFLEGAAFMGIQAHKALPENRRLYAVPVAIRVTHLHDQRPTVANQLAQLATRAGDVFDPEADVVAELTRIGLKLLRQRLHELGHDDPDTSHDLRATLDAIADAILSRIEDAMAIRVRDATDLNGRARRIRSEIHGALLERDQDPAAAAVAAEWADDAMLALRVLSYLTDYVGTKPTIDRLGETVEKLREDLDDCLQPPLGARHAWVAFGTPLPLADFATGKTRVAAATLTDAVETAVQQLLDELSADNPYPGGLLYAPAGGNS